MPSGELPRCGIARATVRGGRRDDAWRRQTLPGETVSDIARTQKVQALDHAFRESLALIRSILIDRARLTASRAHFFANYFCAVHEADRRSVFSCQKHDCRLKKRALKRARLKIGRIKSPYFIALFASSVF
ncbi:MAG: hypothetical protein Q8M24_02350 [Pseudolabrys sp.]|nr:hypothetical protein [Pseudolabrys sp.]MDP2294286.1 hypothetical protein [Pseudolabrys sp.]